MSTLIFRENSQRTFLINLLVCCIIPNILGCLYSLWLFYRKRTKCYAYLFLCLFVLFLTYNYYSVDNTLRFLRVVSGLSSDDWMSGNPLDYLLMFSQTVFGMQSSFVFYLYILVAYLFWYYALYYNTTSKHSGILILIILLCSLALRDVIDLLYYTLAVLFTIFFISKNSNRFRMVDWIVLFVFVYIFHPGLFLLLGPAIVLFYIGGHFHKSIYYVCLVIVYLFGVVLANSHGFSIGVNIIDAQLDVFDSYTSEGKFGVREDKLSGITYTLQFYILPAVYAIVCYIATKNSNTLNTDEKVALNHAVNNYDRKKNKCLKPNLILTLFQVCVAFYPSFLIFVTISERIMVTMGICACFYMYRLVSVGKLSIKIVCYFVVLVFAFTTIRCSSAIQINNLFRAGTYTEIPTRSIYMPSIMLLDYGRWGFSDEFIQNNSMVFDKFR